MALETRLRLPHFLGLGTQKGGTTSLQKLLEQHPGVYLPPAKRCTTSASMPKNPRAGMPSTTATPGAVNGGATSPLLFVPSRRARPHPRAAASGPDDRAAARSGGTALSQVFHARRHGFEALEVADALAAEPERLASGNAYSFQKHSYVARSRYLEQLDRYEALFPSGSCWC